MLKTIIGVVLIIVFAVIVFHTFSEKQEGVSNGCIAPGGRGKLKQSCCHDNVSIVRNRIRYCASYGSDWRTPSENVGGIK